MWQWIAAAGVAFMFSQSGRGRSRLKRWTSGSAQLKANKTYRFELSVDGDAVRKSSNPSDLARGLDNYLRMNGAYDVMVQPTMPILVSYSMRMAGDLPVVLHVPAQQTMGGLTGSYTFTGIQEIAPSVAA